MNEIVVAYLLDGTMRKATFKTGRDDFTATILEDGRGFVFIPPGTYRIYRQAETVDVDMGVAE